MTADHTKTNMTKHLASQDQVHTPGFKKPKAKAAGKKLEADCTRPEEASGRHNADDHMQQIQCLAWAVAPKVLARVQAARPSWRNHDRAASRQ